jgi:hypothetical protein
MVDLDKILQAAKSRYHITSNGPDLGLASANADSKLFDLHAKRAETRGSCGMVRFRPQDVEPLLDQASIILEKALSDRNRWQSAGEKYANLKLDIYNSSRLDAISLGEEQDGRFDVDHFVAEGQQNANQAKHQAAIDQKAEVDALVEILSGDKKSASVQRAVITEYIRAMYSTEFDKQVKYPNGGFTTADKIANADQTLTQAQATEELDKEGHTAAASSKQLAGDIAGLEAVQNGVQKQAEWAGKNAGYLRQRADAARQTLRMKIALAATTALLDFEKQMDSARNMYLEGVWDAYVRLQAVNTGISRYYNYASPNKDPLPEFTDDPASFDAILAWTRRVARWLAAFTRRSNNYVYTISVKQRTGDAWQRGANEASWKFDLPSTAFDAKERHVRIRGVTAWAENDKGKVWQVILKPPANTQVYYESGAKSPIFEQDAPSCRVSKVVSRGKVVIPEVSGLTALYNASPIGTWTIDARLATSPQEIPRTLPDDIELDLYLSVLTIQP